jgi:hypothetical protein
VLDHDGEELSSCPAVVSLLFVNTVECHTGSLAENPQTTGIAGCIRAVPTICAHSNPVQHLKQKVRSNPSDGTDFMAVSAIAQWISRTAYHCLQCLADHDPNRPEWDGRMYSLFERSVADSSCCKVRFRAYAKTIRTLTMSHVLGRVSAACYGKVFPGAPLPSDRSVALRY